MAVILELTGKSLAEILRTYSAYKGWFTKYSTKAQHCDTLLDQSYSRNTESQLHDNLQKAEIQCSNLNQIADFLRQAKYDKHKDHADEVKDFEKVTADLWKSYYARQNAHDAGIPVQNQAQQQAASVKIVSDLKPEPLAHDGTAADLTKWKRQFTAYHSASNMKNANVADQQAYLLTCVDGVLGKRLIRETTITTPVMPVDGVKTMFSILTSFFNQRYPLILKRRLFFEARQKEGEDERHFIESLMSLAEEADIAGMDLNSSLCLMYMSGLTDPKLRQRLGEVEEPTIERFNAIVDSYVHGKTTTVPHAATRATKNSPPQSSSKKKSPRKVLSDSERSRRKQFKGRCFRCGDSRHMLPACPLKPEVKCKACGDLGHISTVCNSQARSAAADAQAGPLPLEYIPDEEQVWSQAGSAHTRSSCCASRQTPELPL
jgi:hypothetical protein